MDERFDAGRTTDVRSIASVAWPPIMTIAAEDGATDDYLKGPFLPRSE